MMNEQRYLTVTALTKYIKRKFDADPHLQNIFVKGEISNFKQHSSGHMYFTLKDEKARILAVMFSSMNRSLKFIPENGMQVIVNGEITVYEATGQYQMYIKEMKPDGVGELYYAYEQLKRKLEEEGLFSAQYKKTLPKYPATVCVITSPTGAAVRDIMTTIKRRYPIAKIVVIPALVQGDLAPKSIVKAIETANQMETNDVIILGRGGGSIEELWAFNEEIVARAIFASKIPIISAVGHETDFTIADFVADHRAPTPTGAAELAVPHISELLDRVLNTQSRLTRTIREQMKMQKAKLTRLQKSYAFRYPRKLYEQKLEALDRATEQLVRSTNRVFLKKSEKHEQLQRRLVKNHPHELLQRAKQKHELTNRTLARTMNMIVVKKQKDFARIISMLSALSPLKIMDRGYSLVYQEDGKLVKSVKQIHVNDSIEINVTDGNLKCKVMEVEERKFSD